MKGWAGKILRVDLCQSRLTPEELDSEILLQYLGGRGLAGKMFTSEVPPDVDPLSPENKIILMTGPLTGTGALCASGTSIVSKSPLHNSMAIANLTGSLGLELKQSGFDGIIIEGTAKNPVILEINDGNVTLKPADSLWGMTTWETEQTLKEQIGNRWRADEYSFLSIGPAGENLSPLASIVHNRFRECGQGGAGAVMGSKNLKAIMLWGNQPIYIADSQELRRSTRDALEKYKSLPVIPTMLRNLGTASLVKIVADLGILPSRNFSSGVADEAEKIYAETLSKTVYLKPKACPTCPIACTRVTQLPGKKPAIIEGPEYEALIFLGSNCGIYNVEHILDFLCHCFMLGLDTLATGSTFATAMELREKGWARKKDMNIPLSFGNAQTMLKAIEQTALRQNAGRMFSDGGGRLAEQYGHPECYMGMRNLESFIADPRGLNTMGLYGVTSNNGAEYFSSFSLISAAYNLTNGLDLSKAMNRSIFVKRLQDTLSASESLGLCPLILVGIDLEDIDMMASAVTGQTFGKKNLIEAGERIWNAERNYHLKAGWNPEDDKLPTRFSSEPMPDGPARGKVCTLKEDLPLYYDLRGWDTNGRPTKE